MSNRKRLLTRDLGTELETRDALIRPRSFNAAARTVEIVAATTTPVPRQDTRGEYDEILDVNGADLSAFRGAPVLNGHRQEGIDNIIGTVLAARVEGNEIIATVQLSQRADLAATVADIEAGIINQVSAGYQVSRWQDGNANGRRTRTAKQWTPREVSMVAVGADPNARTRSRDSSHNPAPTINRQIRELCDRNGVPEIVRDDLIDRGATMEDARMAVLNDMLTRSRTGVRTAHNDTMLDNPEVRVRAMGEALYTRIAPSFRASPQAQQYIGLTIPELARECLNRAGVTALGLGADSLITRALHTTSDFALILGDTVNRTLRDAYQAAPSGIRQLARQTTAADFRKKSRLMLDASGFALEKVNEHGEFKSGTLAEAGESYKVDSYGKIFGITRQALVNDDLGAFSDLTRRLGQAAAAFESQFLVDLLIAQSGLGPDMSDETPLFDSDHGNVSATGAAPDDTTLTAARLAMRKQTGPGGGLISVTPAYVLIPPDMETATEKVLTAIQATSISDVNPFARLTLIVEPRLADAKRWYVVADPAQIDGLEYAYLAGAPGPQTESRAGFEVDGVQVKVRLDYGAGFVDWRGWFSNAGE